VHVGRASRRLRALRRGHRRPLLPRTAIARAHTAIMRSKLTVPRIETQDRATAAWATGAGRLQLGSETAARTCQRAACGLPATAVLPAAGALSVRTVCSGPAAAAASLIGPWSVRQLLEVFGGAGGCRAWHWAGAETCLVVKI
jgi:hypothetical protein